MWEEIKWLITNERGCEFFFGFEGCDKMYGFNILMLKIENIHLDYNLYYWIIKMLHQTRIYIL